MTEGLYAWEESDLLAYLNQLVNATAAERELAANLFKADDDGDDDTESIYSEDDDGAHIQIAGPLSMSGPSGLARLFGLKGTSYKAIMSALDRAGQSPADKVTLHINSPGGEVAGVDQTWQAIRGLAQSKNVVARVEGLCASAAYYLASACNSIEATSPGDEIGSIGVKMVAIDDSGAAEKMGIKRVQIISKNAPNKSDDIHDKAGRAALQDRVDAAERVFMSRVAEGRGVSTDTVKERFGKGGLMLAEDPDHDEEDALSAGMIDKVVPFRAQSGPMPAGPMPRKMPGMRAGYECNDDGTAIRGMFHSPMFAAATGKSDLPIVNQKWDAAAADKRVREFTKSEKEPSASYKNAFFWYDEKDEKNFGAYKLPFADIVNGKMVAIREAIMACNGAMAGARGGVKIPSGDRKAVQAKIDGYMNKIKEQDKKNKKSSSAARAEGGHMNLSEFLEGNPEAQTDLEKIKAESFGAGVKSVQARVDAAKPFLSLDAAEKGYSKAEIEQIGKLAIDVIVGSEDVATMRSFVRLIDMQAEARKQSSANGEQEEQDETPPNQQDSPVMAEAINVLGKDRVEELVAYAQKHGVDVEGTIKAELDHKKSGLVAARKE